MRIERSESRSNEFVLHEQHVKDIHDTILKQLSQATNANNIVTEFNLKLRDLKYGYEASAKSRSADAALAEDNGDIWLIQQFEIKVYDRNQPELLKVSLEFRRHERHLSIPPKVILSYNNFISVFSDKVVEFMHLSQESIKYNIVGDDRDWIYQTSIKLEEKLTKVRQFPFALTSAFLLFLTLCILIFGLASYFSLSIGSKPPLGYIILAGFVLFLLATLGLTFLAFFPPHNFYWGNYKNTFDKKHAIGKNIINLVVLGLAIGVLGSIIATFILLK